MIVNRCGLCGKFIEDLNNLSISVFSRKIAKLVKKDYQFLDQMVYFHTDCLKNYYKEFSKSNREFDVFLKRIKNDYKSLRFKHFYKREIIICEFCGNNIRKNQNEDVKFCSFCGQELGKSIKNDFKLNF